MVKRVIGTSQQLFLMEVVMKRAWIALLLVFFARPLAQSGSKQVTEDARLETLFKDYLATEFKHHPLAATLVGNHDFDHLLDDLSAKARKASIGRTRNMFEELPRKIDYKKLTRSGQIDFEI